jgi:hypothetical protein
MPRRNNSPKHTPFSFVRREVNKQRYVSEILALRAAETAMLQKPDLTLTVYKGSDGGWYLTRKTKT